jgi:TatD DNase family protein
VVEAADAAGVTRILTIGIDGSSCRAALVAAEAFPQVYAGIGRHPNASKGFDDADLAELRALAAHERCRAIGETGLDFYREGAPVADQRRAFAAQIALARETGKPLVVHSRAASEETLAQLGEEADGVSVVMHCFSMPERLEECVRLGYAISFAGNVTYKSATDLAEAARRVPEDRLLVETDAPYLTPQAVRKQRNQPAFVAHTLAFVAELRGVEVELLGTAVARNAARVFGW